MVEVVGVDHFVVSVGDFETSKKFYAPLMEFLDFGVEAEYEGMMGWANGKTLFWIAAADEEGKKHKGMRWGERHEQTAKKRAAKKRATAAKKRTPFTRKKRR